MDRPAAWRSVAIDLESERPFRVGNATVDPISRDGEHPHGRERLQPQTLKVLVALARQRGKVVTRSELIDSCWGGRIVGEDVINRSISMLRDFAERVGGFEIETVPKAGYKLVESASSSSSRPLGRWLIAIAVTAAIAASAWLALRQPAGLEVNPPLVALMPPTSSNDQASRELAAATTDALSHMMVAGSFHGKVLSPASPSDEAKSDIVLRSDFRPSGRNLTALIRVQDRRTGTVIFSRRYERPARDAELLPEQIGAEISTNLTGALALLVLDLRHSGGAEVTAQKLKDIATTVSEEDPLVSYQISRRLAEKHPDSLLALLGVAYDTAFALSSLPPEERASAAERARVSADRLLQIAPDFGDSYAPWCLLRPVTTSRQCEDRLRAGMKADPDAPFTPVFLSSLLFNAGRFEESSQFARIALAGDPFHPQKLRRVVRTLIVLGQEEEAEQLFSRAIRWWPRLEGLQWDRLWAYAITGDFDAAERAIAQMPPTLLEKPRAQLSAMLRLYHSGDRAGVRATCLAVDAGYLLHGYCLTALHNLNDQEGALRVAELLFPRAVGRSKEETEAIWLNDPGSGMDAMLSSPATDWLRREPQFMQFAKRNGSLQYWRNDRLPDFCRPPGESICSVLGKAAART